MYRLAAITAVGLSIAWSACAQEPPTLDVPPVVPFGSRPDGATPGAANPGAATGCAPANLTRMITRNVSPGLAAAAPAAQPRTIYRQGATFLRSEESPDPTRGQPVVIVAEPDIWTINLATRSGQHQIDPGPELVVRAPILPITPDLPPEFRALEYGCELEFLAAAGAAAPRQTVNWGSAKATAHQVAKGEHTISILMATRRQAPLMVAYAKSGQVVFAIRYDDYRNDMTERPTLFAPPEGMKFGAANEQAPKQRPSTSGIDPRREFPMPGEPRKPPRR